MLSCSEGLIPTGFLWEAWEMNEESPYPSRRWFAKSVAALGLGAACGFPASESKAADSKKLKLGIDNFAVRAMGWKAGELIDYAAKLKVDTLFITDLYAFENVEDGYLEDLRKAAADKGLEILLGGWSICPSSVSFKDEWGTAEEHLALGIRMAEALGSPAYRVILGNGKDRMTEGGIEARIADTVKVLKASRSRAMDAGVKVAVENHAGDMHSLELVRLIEEAGTDFVGANMDSGNAVSTLEDPQDSLENLGRYAVTTSLRDSAIWATENGATTQWTAMGDGDVDWKVYFSRFAELCPDTAVNIETISGGNREIPYLKKDFWKAWPGGKPKGFDQFVAWAKKGRPREAHQGLAGVDRKQADQEYQRAELERSIRYCREELGLGLRG